MALSEKIAAIEKQVAELFDENRELTRQIRELTGRDRSAQQIFDIKALALRIHRDGWDAAYSKPRRGGRHDKKTVA